MPTIRRVKTESGADKLRARVEPETTATATRSPGRSTRAASKSPARLAKGGPTRNSQRGNFDYLRGTVPNPDVPMDFTNHTPSPPKQRKVDEMTINSLSSATRRMNFSSATPPHTQTDIQMSTEDDLVERVDKMIVSLLGGNRRKRKQEKSSNSDSESMPDEEMEEGVPGSSNVSGPFAAKAKRSAKEFDLSSFNEIMDIIDDETKNDSSAPRDFFSEWRKLLLIGQYNVLITGVGSKVRLIQSFMDNVNDPPDVAVFEVNGFSHDISMRSMLHSVELEFNLKTKLPKSASTSSFGQRYAVALGEALANARFNLILAIHSLDGPNLRDSSQQAELASFVEASKGHVNIIGSIDHENATQIWGPEMNDSLAWINYPLNMLQSYKKEVLSSHSTLMKRQNAAESHTLASLDVFWHALPSSAQRELFLLTTLCVDNVERSVELNVLFDKARSGMITTSRQSMEAHLKEFRDHNLISMTQDVVKLIIDHNLLLRFMQSKGMDED